MTADICTAPPLLSAGLHRSAGGGGREGGREGGEGERMGRKEGRRDERKKERKEGRGGEGRWETLRKRGHQRGYNICNSLINSHVLFIIKKLDG